jgi:hypothetical protein
MPLLNACTRQIDKYSFLIWDTTTQEMYDAAGIDLTSNVTAARIDFTDLRTGTTYAIDILSRWSYLLGDGITINIATDFTGGVMGDYNYFPDWSYTIAVVYTYLGTEYTSSKTIGFRAIVSNVVYQETQQMDWNEELKCWCGCAKESLTSRKFNYLRALEKASNNCLITQYNTILLALYKITASTHEYA